MCSVDTGSAFAALQSAGATGVVSAGIASTAAVGGGGEEQSAAFVQQLCNDVIVSLQPAVAGVATAAGVYVAKKSGEDDEETADQAAATGEGQEEGADETAQPEEELYL